MTTFDFMMDFLFLHKYLLRADNTKIPPEKNAIDVFKTVKSSGNNPIYRIKPITPIKNKPIAKSNVWNFGVVKLFK